MNSRLLGVLLFAMGAVAVYTNRVSTDRFIRTRRAPAEFRGPIRLFYVVIGAVFIALGFGLMVGWLPA
jgi:hypothetical protein